MSCRNTGGAASLAILAPVGEVDPLGCRGDGLDAFVDQKVDEGYVIETRVAKDTLRTHPLVHGRASTAEGRIVLKRVGWLGWPCVPGRRPRPNGIDAPSNAREMRD